MRNLIIGIGSPPQPGRTAATDLPDSSAIQTAEKEMQLLYRVFPIGLSRRIIVPGAVRRPVNPALKSHVHGMDIGGQVQETISVMGPGRMARFHKIPDQSRHPRAFWRWVDDPMDSISAGRPTV